MVSEVKISLTTEDGKYTKKHLIYEPFTMSTSDEVLKQCIKQTIDECKAPVDRVRITAKMDLD